MYMQIHVATLVLMGCVIMNLLLNLQLVYKLLINGLIVKISVIDIWKYW